MVLVAPRSGLVLSAVLLCSPPASAQVPELPEVIVRDAHGVATIRTIRTPSPIIVDGQLEEAVYRDVKPFGDFVQQEPFEGQPATEKTDVWVFFDDKNVYCRRALWETDPSRRVTSDMRRDANNLYNNDHFAVLFDTFNDRRNGFGFSSNAQGGMFDWQVTNEQPSNNWNGLWDVRTANFDGGWTVEFRDSRSARCASRKARPVWGINFRRMVRWKNEVSYLSPVPLSWGRRGLSKVSSGGHAGRPRDAEQAAQPRRQAVRARLGRSPTTLATPAIDNDATAEFGVDAKWGITQSLVADFTYNTDFAQVEDDEAQVNLTRFSVLFPEKRDFFLEGPGRLQLRAAAAPVAGRRRRSRRRRMQQPDRTTRRSCSSAAASACRTARWCRFSPAPACSAAPTASRSARCTCRPRTSLTARARRPPTSRCCASIATS